MSGPRDEPRGAPDEAAAPTPRDASWSDAAAAGRFEEAHRLYLVQDGDDLDLSRALDGLADLRARARAKSWTMASRRLERLEELPARLRDVVDRDELAASLAAAAAGAAAIDRGDAEAALGRLAEVRAPALAGEREALRGAALVRLGRDGEARSAFEEALRLDPKHARALVNLGNLDLEAGATDEAIARYERAIELDEDLPNAHHNLGVALRRKGRIGASVRSLRKAQGAARRRDAEDARGALGRAAARSGRRIRWALVGLVVLAAWLLLRGRGDEPPAALPRGAEPVVAQQERDAAEPPLAGRHLPSTAEAPRR